MKNIQIIDSALNCTFSIFQATEEEFSLLYPEPDQDIQYAEDLADLPKQDEIASALKHIWSVPSGNAMRMVSMERCFISSNATSMYSAISGKIPSIHQS